MKILIYIFLVLCLSLSCFAQVNGELQTIDGKKVLKIWGTHYERGYAHGYLLGVQFKQVFTDYILNYICYNNATIYNTVHSFFVNNYIIESNYQTEAEAMIQGMIDNGVDIYNSTLGRDMNASDILLCTSLPDLTQSKKNLIDIQLGCSSLSSWGDCTFQDSTLSGALMITRLMDWSNHSALYQNHLLIVHFPSEANEQKWISLAFAGFLGSLSGINESGVSTFMNVGNITNYTTTNPFYPILLTVRNGIETKDYNQDLENNATDIAQAVQDRNRSGASIIHSVRDDAYNSLPLIIECNNENGVSVRDTSDNTQVPSSHLVATNHFRTLYTPVSCYRYNGIVDSLNDNSNISSDRSWAILKNAAGVGHNLHAMQYIPCVKLLKWATSSQAGPAYTHAFTSFNLDSLFKTPVVSVEQKNNQVKNNFTLFQNYPNPFNPRTNIQFSIPKSEMITLKIYNILGEEVATLVSEKLNAGNYKYNWDAEQLPSGIYFYKIKTSQYSQTKKLILLR